MDQAELRELLQQAGKLLSELRTRIAAGGHMQALLEFDTLIGVAAEEARGKLRSIDARKRLPLRRRL
jgi:hypothetical protein